MWFWSVLVLHVSLIYIFGIERRYVNFFVDLLQLHAKNTPGLEHLISIGLALDWAHR